MSKKPPPPRLAPKPGIVKAYKALYSYTKQHPDELSFEEDDILYVSDQADENWWKASCKGKNGLVPSNYVAAKIEDQIDFPLQEAAKRGNLEFLRECIKEKFALNGVDKSGSTALYWASHGGHAMIVHELLSNNCVDLNKQNKLGDTAVHAAAWKGHAHVLRMLLDKGAKKNILNNDKKLPMDLASDPEAAALLKERQVISQNNDDYVGDGYDSD